MKRMTGVVLLVAMTAVVCGTARGDDQADARAIVAKAIKATGGEEKLDKFKAQTSQETGTYYGMGDGLPYTGKYSMQFPDKFRMEIVGIFTIVVNGDKGWMSANGNTEEMNAEQLKVQQESLYVGLVSSLVPLKDKKFKLATHGEIKIKDRPAVGVRVTAENRRDVKLYFDKESGLLVKIENRAISEEQGGKEVDDESFLSDHKDVNGVKVPMKMLMMRDGKKFVESETTEIQVLEKLDDGVFGKP